jgi:tetratricopeptide (TPR) repeat protein
MERQRHLHFGLCTYVVLVLPAGVAAQRLNETTPASAESRGSFPDARSSLRSGRPVCAAQLYEDTRSASDEAMARHDYAVAERLLREAILVAERLGFEGEILSELLLEAAYVQNRQGNSNESLAAAKTALDIARARPSSSWLLVNLFADVASVYACEKRFDEAAVLQRQALLICKTAFGKNQPRLTLMLFELTAMEVGRRNYREAELVATEAVTILENLPTADRSVLAKAIVHLGTICRLQSRNKDAERLLRRGIAILENTSPLSDPTLAGARAELAWALLQRGKIDEVAALLAKSSPILLQNKSRLLEPDRAHAALDLSLTQVSLDQLARSLEQLAFARARLWLGVLLFRQIQSVPHTPDVERRQVHCFERVPSRSPLRVAPVDDKRKLASQETVVNDEIRAKARAYEKLRADAFKAMYRADFAGAEESFQLSFDMAVELGFRSACLVDALLWRAYAEASQGKTPKSLLTIEQALEIVRGHSLAPLRMASALEGIASWFLVSGQFDHAEPLMRESVNIRERLLGESDPQVLMSLQRLASVEHARQDYFSAQVIAKRIVSILDRLPAAGDVALGLSLVKLGDELCAEKALVDAEMIARLSVDILTRSLPDNDDRLADARFVLAKSLFQQGKLNEAKSLVRSAILSSQQNFGLAHPRTRKMEQSLAKIQSRELRLGLPVEAHR